MASVPTLEIGGTDASTYGVYINRDVDGWLDAPPATVSITPKGGRIGGWVSRYPTIPPRVVKVPIRLTADAVTTRETREQTLKANYLANVTLQLDDGTTDRTLTGYLLGVRLRPYGVPVSNTTDGVLKFVCEDPLWKATGAATSEAVSSTPNALALGNAPISDWVLTVTASGGDIVDPTVTIGSDTMTFTGTISSGNSLVVDASDFTVENNAVDARSSWTGGFPAINPLDTPSVSAVKDSGAGTEAGSLAYHKRYW